MAKYLAVDVINMAINSPGMVRYYMQPTITSVGFEQLEDELLATCDKVERVTNRRINSRVSENYFKKYVAP